MSRNGPICVLSIIFLSLHFAASASLQQSFRSTELQKKSTELENSGTRSWPQARAGRDAYVTLLYGGFLLGARVLGQSLRETETKKDRIVLCTETVSEATQKVLKDDGWIIKHITNIHSPYEGLSTRGDYFSGIFSKLHVWNLTEYERIIYLDSDVLVLSDIDHMFDCGTFCAAYRHSDFFNAGIIVVEPNAAIFKDMLGKITKMHSYDDGDQGFLNVYFKDLVYASFFNWSNDARQRQPMRMPAGLNADIGNYYANSRWVIPEDEMRVIHYTLGPLKPWIWWTNFLFDQNVKWTAVRMRLPRYPHHDDTFKPASLPHFWFPYPILIILYFGVKFIDYSRWFNKKCAAKMLRVFNSIHTRFSHFFPLTLLLLSYYLAYRLIVPMTMLPSQAEYVFWLWSNFFLLVLMGLCCYLCHVTNKLHENYHHSSSRKKLKTLFLYVIFSISYILVKVVPPAVKPFSKRVYVFFILLSIHVFVGHMTGQWVIQIWSWFGRIDSESRFSSRIDSDPKINRSQSAFSLKKMTE